MRQRGDSAPVNEQVVEALLQDREVARKSRDYRTADGIRDQLQAEFGAWSVFSRVRMRR